MPVKCSNYKLKYCALIACFCTFSSGVCLGWVSGAYHTTLADTKIGLNLKMDVLQWVPACFTVGGLLMVYPVYIISCYLGPKTTLLVMHVPWFIAWIIIIPLPSPMLIYTGFFLIGGTVCNNCWLVRVYLKQISINGNEELIAVNKTMAGWGFTYSSILGALLEELRSFNMLCLVPSFVVFICIMTIPESPIYFLRQKQYESAFASLKRLRPKSHPIRNELIDKMDLLDRWNKKGYMNFRTIMAKHRHYFQLESIMYFLKQMTGVESYYFICGVYKVYGSDYLAPKYLGICFAITLLLSMITSYQLSKVLSCRLQSIFACVLLFGTSFFISIFSTSHEENPTLIEKTWIVPLATVLYTFAYNLGYSSLPLCIEAEFFPVGVENFTAPVFTFMDLAFRLIVQLFLWNALMTFHFAKVMTVFTFFNFLSLIFTSLHLPRVAVTSSESFEDDEAAKNQP